MVEDNKLSKYLISIFFFVLFLLVIIGSIRFNILFNSIKYNLGDYIYGYLGNLLLIGFFASLFFFFFLFFLLRTTKIKNRISISLTFSLITFVLILGIILIPELLGVKEINLNLNPSPFSGEITCNNVDGGVIVIGSKVSCNIETTIKFDYVNLTLTKINSSQTSLILDASNNYSFIMPPDIKRISFELMNNSLKYAVSTSWNYNFKTYDEYESNLPLFLAAFLSLILLAFLTVPQIVLNFKKLFNKQ